MKEGDIISRKDMRELSFRIVGERKDVWLVVPTLHRKGRRTKAASLVYKDDDRWTLHEELYEELHEEKPYKAEAPTESHEAVS